MHYAGIVYCFSRKDTEQVTKGLTSRGIKAACYHADIDYKTKSRNHRDWVSRKVQVIEDNFLIEFNSASREDENYGLYCQNI